MTNRKRCDDCRNCMHFELDAACKDYDPQFQYGTCSIKFGNKVEIQVDGGWVDSVLVDADFGCRAWESKRKNKS